MEPQVDLANGLSGSGLCLVWVNFGLSMFGSGTGPVKFGSGLFQVNYVRVRHRFGSIEVWVGSISGGTTITCYGLGMRSVFFESGEIRSNIRVNIR